MDYQQFAQLLMGIRPGAMNKPGIGPAIKPQGVTGMSPRMGGKPNIQQMGMPSMAPNTGYFQPQNVSRGNRNTGYRPWQPRTQPSPTFGTRPVGKPDPSEYARPGGLSYPTRPAEPAKPQMGTAGGAWNLMNAVNQRRK